MSLIERSLLSRGSFLHVPCKIWKLNGMYFWERNVSSVESHWNYTRIISHGINSMVLMVVWKWMQQH